MAATNKHRGKGGVTRPSKKDAAKGGRKSRPGKAGSAKAGGKKR